MRFTRSAQNFYARRGGSGFRHSLIMLGVGRVLAVYANYFKVNHYYFLFCFDYIVNYLVGSTLQHPGTYHRYDPADCYEWMRFFLRDEFQIF